MSYHDKNISTPRAEIESAGYVKVKLIACPLNMVDDSLQEALQAPNIEFSTTKTHANSDKDDIKSEAEVIDNVAAYSIIYHINIIK